MEQDNDHKLVNAIIAKDLNSIKLYINNIEFYSLLVKQESNKFYVLLQNMEWLWHEHVKSPFLNDKTITGIIYELARNHLLITPTVIEQIIPHIPEDDRIAIFGLLTVNNPSDDVKNIARFVLNTIDREKYSHLELDSWITQN